METCLENLLRSTCYASSIGFLRMQLCVCTYDPSLSSINNNLEHSQQSLILPLGGEDLLKSCCCKSAHSNGVILDRTIRNTRMAHKYHYFNGHFAGRSCVTTSITRSCNE